MIVFIITELSRECKEPYVTVSYFQSSGEVVKFGLQNGNFTKVNDMTPESHKDSPQNAALASVLENFPEAVPRIRELFLQSPDFQSLCEDYRECLANWRHWQQATSEQASAYGKIYAELLQELEQEVRQSLEPDEA
jgi:hypothetical protein